MRKFLRRVWAWLQSGFGPTTLLGLAFNPKRVLGMIWHRLGDFDLLRSLWSDAGPGVPLIVQIVGNPFFGVGLIFAGLLGFPFVINVENEKVHKVIPVAGWALFGLVSSLIFSTFLFSSYATSSGTIRARKFWVENHTIEEGGTFSQRHLTDKQFQDLVNYLKIIPNIVKATMTISSSSDDESQIYASEFRTAFAKAGATDVSGGIGGQDPSLTYSAA